MFFKSNLDPKVEDTNISNDEMKEIILCKSKSRAIDRQGSEAQLKTPIFQSSRSQTLSHRRQTQVNLLDQQNTLMAPQNEPKKLISIWMRIN